MRAKRGDLVLVGFDMQLVDHVVDILAGGDPNGAVNWPTREPTSVDVALCMPVVGTIMNQLHIELQLLGPEARLEPFEVIQTEHLPTKLSYLLSEQQFLSARVNLDIGDGGRTGHFYLVLPPGSRRDISAVRLLARRHQTAAASRRGAPGHRHGAAGNSQAQQGDQDGRADGRRTTRGARRSIGRGMTR